MTKPDDTFEPDDEWKALARMWEGGPLNPTPEQQAISVAVAMQELQAPNPPSVH